MERVAAGPIDEADVGIGASLAVIAVGRARVQQHVRDARHRNEVRHSVPALRQGCHRDGIRASPVIGDRAERIRSEEHTSELQSLMRISYAVFCLTKRTNKYLMHNRTRL